MYVYKKKMHCLPWFLVHPSHIFWRHIYRLIKQKCKIRFSAFLLHVYTYINKIKFKLLRFCWQILKQIKLIYTLDISLHNNYRHIDRSVLCNIAELTLFIQGGKNIYFYIHYLFYYKGMYISIDWWSNRRPPWKKTLIES